MNTKLRTSIFAVGMVVGLTDASAALTHRYSFTSDANDSVGVAHGSLQGSATISVADGAVVLDGTVDTYVDLPGGLITGYTAVTFEAWTTVGVNGNWSRLFDFGDTNPDSGNGRNYILVTPHSGAGDTRLVVSDADPGFNHEDMVAKSGVLDGLGKTHVAAVFDSATGFMGLYINGGLVAWRTNATIKLSAVNNVHSYLGKSLYVPDAYMTGSIDEFRIYDQALTSPEIGASYASGPGTPSTDPGAFQSVALEIDSPSVLLGGFAQAATYGNYAKAPHVNLAGIADVTYQSANTAIATVSSQGLIKAVGLGSTTITTTYQGQQDTKTVAVVQPQAKLVHRYSFGESADSTTAKDSVGTADGTLVGGATFTGNGKLTLDGTDGYVDLPNGIISSLTNATFEAWVTWNADSVWQRIFDFGSNSAGEDQQGTGQTYLFLTPRGGSGVVRFASTVGSGGGETPVLNAPAALSIGQATHVAVTYNYSARVAKLYVNGQLAASGTASLTLKSIQDVNNWLGRSNWPDPFFNGDFDEFRIYEGALTDFEVALSAAAGPDKTGGTDPGEVQSVDLSVTSPLVAGALVRSKLTANYVNVPGVDVTANPNTTYQSSDPTVLVVSSTGVVDAVGTGTAIVTGTYLGKQGTVTVTVTAPSGVPAKALLAHRYSFSETSGTTVKDSVGTADGTVMGTATFTGNGQLSLPGGASGSDAGFVDLPNGLISQLTNATFEAWLTWRGTAFWERIFDFGNNTAGEDQQGTGDTYVFLSPHGGANVVRFAITLTSGGPGETQLDGPALFPANQETHVVVTYNYVAGNARLFLNGQRVATANATLALTGLNDVNVWLGKSNWPDPYLNALFNEFRLYNGTLSEKEIAADFEAGPDRLPDELGTEPELTITQSGASITLSWPTSATGYVLEETPSLGTGVNWSQVSGSPTIDGTVYKFPATITGAERYYRLKKP